MIPSSGGLTPLLGINATFWLEGCAKPAAMAGALAIPPMVARPAISAHRPATDALLGRDGKYPIVDRRRRAVPSARTERDVMLLLLPVQSWIV
ncbi:MAG TPA: hypothetical protein VFW09_06225 [Solirubrobacteraceae bacterium]|nr:hypothetical protein [Solirubrobacteraceae bacterium]